MQVLPIDPSFQRVILQGNHSPEGLQLTLGQQISMTVLKVREEGQLLLGFGAQKIWARSELPFVEGQQLQLRVNQNAATVELQLLGTTRGSDVENYELAALLQASGGLDGTGQGEFDSKRLLQGLQQLMRPDGQLLTENQSGQLRALLEPLTVGSEPKILLPQIKNLIENSGVFFEAKLRTLLEALNASPEAALQKLASDLKLLLGHLHRPLQAAETPPSLSEETKSDPEQSAMGDASRNLAKPGDLTSSDRQSGLPERTLALKALLDLVKASPDQGLQKLAAEAATLLQNARREHTLSQMATNTTDSLMNKTGFLGATHDAVSELPLGQRHPMTQPTQHETLSKAGPSFQSSVELAETMRDLLEAVRSTSEPEVRKLLPELATLLARTEEQVLLALSETAPTNSKPTVRDQITLLSDQVLSRQAEAALEWLKNGNFQAELPMQFGTHSTQARIRFFQENQSDAKQHSGRPLNINIYLDLPDTGKVEAWARWEGPHIQATLYVRDAETRKLFESQLQELSASLESAGFSTAVLDVRIDPARLYKIQETDERSLPPEGSLLSLRV